MQSARYFPWRLELDFDSRHCARYLSLCDPKASDQVIGRWFRSESPFFEHKPSLRGSLITILITSVRLESDRLNAIDVDVIDMMNRKFTKVFLHPLSPQETGDKSKQTTTTLDRRNCGGRELIGERDLATHMHTHARESSSRSYIVLNRCTLPPTAFRATFVPCPRCSL